MNKLILHIGPGKCGSSSIQGFFMTNKNSCIENLKFILLDPKEIAKISSDRRFINSSNYFIDLIKNSFKKHPVTILSHEYLFNKPLAISNICGLAKDNCNIDEILILGYCRRQSEYIESAYSQWFFRAPSRIDEIKSTMRNVGVIPDYFNGLERQLIGSILNEFYSARQLSGDYIIDWNLQYKEIEDRTSNYGASVKCGVLPQNETGNKLIKDFSIKSGLTLRSDVNRFSNMKRNLKFDSQIIEAMNIAVDLGMEVPAPHGDNDFFANYTQNIDHFDSFESKFLLTLKQYIDFYFLESNKELCQKYNFDMSYFEVSKKYTKDQVLRFIESEQILRSQNGLVGDRYRKLIGILAQALYNNYKKKL